MGLLENRMTAAARRLVADDRGATAIEYGLIAALIAVSAITAMNGLGTQLKSTFNKTSTVLSVANAAS
jgi:pilus assembly protein Flp/PilA